MFFKVDVIIEDDLQKYLSNTDGLAKIKDFYLYLCHLFKNHRIYDNNSLQVFNYLDFFQTPLQPLRDNLQSQTYECFENVKLIFII